ncbi:thioesterase family protein [Actibacterium pelagium]|uniref:4-hydroxybenzoyl-CoA thioesterase n=1 Tax=Actibacterium pelagium TaxID=2029103 RepID=A0A917AD56_9RHOB|nr:thioesterase family protein [Actibacterium pelagium]GGE44178.1 4-hydroxybenzoyl-CoA thioesterase [Actibacterium pelagium]
MSETFLYETEIHPDWIDYNGHMRDAFYGLVFSFAVDSFQDEVGFDEAYRKQTGCTIYLLEEHKYYLKEVKVGDRVRVETVVLGSDQKRFHLYLQMIHNGEPVAICEFMLLHVNQHPTPHAEAMPSEIADRLARAKAAAIQDIPFRSRLMALKQR